MKTFLTIRDKGGDVIWNAETVGPLAYLREGDIFWYGSADLPNWARVVSFTCGLDTRDGRLAVELIVEATVKKSVPGRKPQRREIDHGEKWVVGKVVRSGTVENGVFHSNGGIRNEGDTWVIGGGISLRMNGMTVLLDVSNDIFEIDFQKKNKSRKYEIKANNNQEFCVLHLDEKHEERYVSQREGWESTHSYRLRLVQYVWD